MIFIGVPIWWQIVKFIRRLVTFLNNPRMFGLSYSQAVWCLKCFAFLSRTFRSFTRVQNKTIHICAWGIRIGHHCKDPGFFLKQLRFHQIGCRISRYFLLLGSKMGFWKGCVSKGGFPSIFPYNMQMEFDTKQLHQLPFSEGHQVRCFKNTELGNKRNEPPKPRSTLHFYIVAQ